MYLQAKDTFGFTDWDMLGDEAKQKLLGELKTAFGDSNDWGDVGL